MAYFFIVSKALTPDGHRLAISAYSNGEVHVAKLNYNDDQQMWQKQAVTTRNDRNPFGLINKKYNLALARDVNHQGAKLLLHPLDQINFNELAMWRDEANWGGINSYADWEQKINIPGNGPYTDGQRLVTWGYGGGAQNETWFYVQDNTKQEVVSFQFQVDMQQIFYNLDPEVYVQSTDANLLNQQVNMPQIQLSQQTSDSITFTDSSSIKWGIDVEISGGIPDIGEASTKFGVETSYKKTDSNTLTVTKTVQETVSLNVPPKSKGVLTLMIQKGKLDVPYTAVIKYTYTDGRSETKSYSGTFTRVSAYQTTVKIATQPA